MIFDVVRDDSKLPPRTRHSCRGRGPYIFVANLDFRFDFLFVCVLCVCIFDVFVYGESFILTSSVVDYFHLFCFCCCFWAEWRSGTSKNMSHRCVLGLHRRWRAAVAHLSSFIATSMPVTPNPLDNSFHTLPTGYLDPYTTVSSRALDLSLRALVCTPWPD